MRQDSKPGYEAIGQTIEQFLAELLNRQFKGGELRTFLCAPKEHGGLGLVIPGEFHDLMKETQRFIVDRINLKVTSSPARSSTIGSSTST